MTSAISSPITATVARPVALPADGSDRVHPLGHAVGDVGELRSGLLLGQRALLDVLGDALLGLGDEGRHEIVGAHTVGHGDLRKRAASSEFRPQGLGVDTEQIGHDLRASGQVATTPMTLTTARHRLDEMLRDGVGLITVDRRIVDEGLQHLSNP